MIPRSQPLVTEQLQTIDRVTFKVILLLSCLSMIAAVVFMALLMYHRESKAIKGGSWRLNLIMCIGCIMSSISAILFGVDESWNAQSSKDKVDLDLMCNARLWLEIVAFTVLLMPLFAKTYHLSRMFNNVLQSVMWTDRQLLVLVSTCIAVDLVLMSTFVVVQPVRREMHFAELHSVDELQQTQFVFGQCSGSVGGMYGLVLLWKLVEFAFGIHAALSVSRIRKLTEILYRFDETGIQLFSIFCTVMTICCAVTVSLMADMSLISFYFHSSKKPTGGDTQVQRCHD